MNLPVNIENLIEEFSKVPGIGRKTAVRYVMNLTNWEKNSLESFGHALLSLTTLKKCEQCGFFCEERTCEVCNNPRRAESSTLCVVENVSDCLAIENSGTYQGLYHVLGGVLNPLLGVGPDELFLSTLVSRLNSGTVKTVILAINPSVEGDATCSYLRDIISDDVEVERIGFGMPMGGNIEFLDSLTISKALENRKRL